MAEDKILIRIQKLLEMADPNNGAMQNEMEVATQKIAELLDAHGLTMSEVATYEAEESTDITHSRTYFQYTDMQGTVYIHQRNQWVVSLVTSIAYANYCKDLHGPSSAVFIGRRRDVEIAEYLFDHLIPKLVQMSGVATKAHCMAHKERWGVDPWKDSNLRPSEHPRRWRKSWLEGAVSGVSQILMAPRREAEMEENKYALVVTHEDKLQEYYKENWGGGKGFSRTASSNGSSRAYNEGVRAGKTISVNPGVGSGSKRKRLT